MKTYPYYLEISQELIQELKPLVNLRKSAPDWHFMPYLTPHGLLLPSRLDIYRHFYEELDFDTEYEKVIKLAIPVFWWQKENILIGGEYKNFCPLEEEMKDWKCLIWQSGCYKGNFAHFRVLLKKPDWQCEEIAIVPFRDLNSETIDSLLMNQKTCPCEIG